jgi:hypothetical protein
MSSEETNWSEETLSPLEQAVASFMKAWVDETEAARSSIEPPELLHHYTDVGGLLGIVESGTLWASSAPFLNDQTELSHSLILLGQIIRGERHEVNAGSPNEAADHYLNQVVNNFYLFLEVYLVCFCDSPDLLSQWRAYGQGQGYAIGFKSDQLARMAMLQKVTYDLEEQIRALAHLVRRWRKIFVDASPDASKSASERMVVLSLATALVRTIVGFKNEAFDVEQEWRLVVMLPSFFPETLRFRARAGMVMGPRRDQNIAGHGLDKLLQTNGYIGVKPRWSNVPLRT